MKNSDSSVLALSVAAASNTDQSWTELCNCIAETFRFTEDEKVSFSMNRVAKLIAAIPFAAGCDEPARTALGHLAVYMTELRGGSIIGGHNPSDNEDIFTRLRLLSSYKGGNQEIISHGMHQLALVMIVGYEKSMDKDEYLGVYNPLNDGSWNAEEMKLDILRELKKSPNTILDSIVPGNLDDLVFIW
ncbi:hypothetical protein K7I13_00745 [Brucepastera parasyntrophica]|uniref:hypothetical protein n=1 Tax=Brucepastera parasyntrophica TaxID=2880008 RepID=UPI002109A2F6|nr:hypothetical protein [Brucepastera parasyntrophica]ULQ59909.1 hypothetical protein K7I13_00745 [Brucepastera parasyntrophica]